MGVEVIANVAAEKGGLATKRQQQVKLQIRRDQKVVFRPSRNRPALADRLVADAMDVAVILRIDRGANADPSHGASLLARPAEPKFGGRVEVV